MKAYTVMDLETQKIYNSIDVIFQENIFPFSYSFQKPMFMPTRPKGIDEHPILFPDPINTDPVASDQIHQQHYAVHNQNSNSTSIRRSSRTHKAPSYLNDYVHSTYVEPFCFTTLTSLSLQPPTLHSHCLRTTSPQLLERLNFTEPQSYAEATLHPDWQAAMDEELQALQDTKTSDIVPLS